MRLIELIDYLRSSVHTRCFMPETADEANFQQMIGLMAEGVGQRATTDYTHEKFYEALNDGGNQRFGLKPYELAGKSKDEIRKVVKEQAVVVAWAGQPIPKSVTHVSVKFNDEWESKLGDMHQVGLGSAAVTRNVTTALTTGSR